MARQGPTAAVGLGYAQHQKPRAQAIKRLAPGTPCPYCGHPMYPTVELAAQAGLHPRLWRLHYDHVIPRALGGASGPKRLTHGYCNMRAGQVLRTKLYAGRSRKPRAYTRW